MEVNVHLRKIVEGLSEVDFYTGVVVINTAKDSVLLTKRNEDK